MTDQDDADRITAADDDHDAEPEPKAPAPGEDAGASPESNIPPSPGPPGGVG